MGNTMDNCCVSTQKEYVESYDLMPGKREFKID